MQRWSFVFWFLLLGMAVLTHTLAPRSARAEPSVVADLSQHLIAINTNFSGTRLFIFGATDVPGDILAVVRGPAQNITMHRKDQIAGIWANVASVTFIGAPGFYAMASTRPLADLAPDFVLARHEMGIENIRLRLPRAHLSENLLAEWRAALIRNQEAVNLYNPTPQPLQFLGNRLFRASIAMPTNIPTGTYQVTVYLLQNEQVIAAQTTPLVVSKIGAEAEIYYFAQTYPALYGIASILLALLAGWLAHLAFRRR